MTRQARIAADPPGSLYEQDHLAWIERQSELLRAGRLQDLDLENIAEELDDLGRSQRRELEHRLEIIFAHLLKKQFQPKRHTRSWDVTIGEQRRQIERLFRFSPSLRHDLEATLRRAYADAIKAAAVETGLPRSAIPAELPFTIEQALADE